MRGTLCHILHWHKIDFPSPIYCHGEYLNIFQNTVIRLATITVTIAQDTNVTAAEVTALYNAANERKATWTAAGYEEEAQNLINSLADLKVAAEVGETAIPQDRLNSEYTRLLAKYNEMEAKVNS